MGEVALVLRSPLAGDIRGLVATKRAMGLGYESAELAFARIDAWLVGLGHPSRSLPREVVEDWCRRRPHESERTHHHRVSEMRVLCRHLSDVGVEAWVPPKGLVRKGPRYDPHIYTDDELARFFAAVDASRPVPGEGPWRDRVAPVFWRVLYSTGMRLSEARLRRVGDLDERAGTLVVTGAKGRKDRLVPLHADLVPACAGLVAITGEGADGYLFPVRPGTPMTLQNAYRNFRRYLERAGIPHTGRGPRIHDLRHTFCVRLLLRWVEEGKDPLAWLPYMRTALGHESFEETAYYLRLTAEAHPAIKAALDASYPEIVEEVDDDGREFH